jgi:hypothetical protein
MPDAIKAQLEKLESIATRYDDIIGREAEDLRREYEITDAARLSELLAKINDEFRLLHIGIIGKVKAGKSSLLNAVFFDGQNILPKAATPMTASLTQLVWGDSCKAVVEYFSADDIQAIKAAHDKYEHRLQEAYDIAIKELADKQHRAPLSQPEMEQRARRTAERSIQDESLKAAHDQYERMRSSGFLQEFQAGKAPYEFSTENREELMRELSNYVGSSGKYMPFTRNVVLSMPEPGLKDIAIVDTPGLNDPVASRSQRTQEYLAECNVVFIVSPAGQFVSKEDTGLMDRLSSRKGVRELYLVASMADNQLHGDAGEKAQWDLNTAVSNIRHDLASHAKMVLSELRAKCPETEGQFDQLLEPGSKRIIITSSACNALGRYYDDKDKWDGTMRHTYDLLRENYPDYFDDRNAALANLGKLDGIAEIQAAIEDARQKKNAILEKQREDLLASTSRAVTAYSSSLLSAVRGKTERLEKTDMATIQNDKAKLQSVRANATAAVDDAFAESLDYLRQNLRDAIAQERNRLFAGMRTELANSEKEETRTSHYSPPWWKFWESSSTSTYTVTTVRAGAVKSQLSTLRDDLAESLLGAVEKCKNEWKQTVQRLVTKAVTESVQDENSIDFQSIKTALRRQIGSMEIPELDFSSCSFESSASGKLEDYEAERFLSEAHDYMARLRSYFQSQTAQFIKGLESSVRKYSMSELLFNDIKEQIEQLEQDIENKQAKLERLRDCAKELEASK